MMMFKIFPYSGDFIFRLFNSICLGPLHYDFLSQLKLPFILSLQNILSLLKSLHVSRDICVSWELFEVFLKKIDSLQSEIITEIPRNNSFTGNSS